MDISSPEFGLANIVRSPGFCERERVDLKVIQAERSGLVRRAVSTFPSIFIRPGYALHFETFIGGRLVMLRGIWSREMTTSDADIGHLRENHVWIVFGPKACRSIAVDANPLLAREVWVRPQFFDLDRSITVTDKNGSFTGSLPEMMDRLVASVDSIRDDSSLDTYSKEASRLRCLFAAAILEGATTMPDIELPSTASGVWSRALVNQCWSRARALVDPFVVFSDVPSWSGRPVS